MIIIQISKMCIEDILGQSLKVVLLLNSICLCYSVMFTDQFTS